MKMWGSQRSFARNTRYAVDKKKEMSIAEEFTEILDDCPGTESGIKYIPDKVFTRLLERVKTPQDIQHMKDLTADYYGHRNSVKSSSLDLFLIKGLKIDAVAMLEYFKYHRQLFYYPTASIIEKYVDHFVSQDDYENYAKKLIQACLNEHWLKKTSNFYNKLISYAHKNGDNESTKLLYIDILDYDETILSTHAIN